MQVRGILQVKYIETYLNKEAISDLMSLIKELGLWHDIPKKELEHLFLFEVHFFLKKIYAKLKGRGAVNLTFPKEVSISRNLFSIHEWKIKLNSDEEVAIGNVGKISLRSDFAFHKKMRKKAAAMIAAQWYLYQLYAKQGNLDEIRKPLKHAYAKRPSLVVHVLKLIGEEKWIFVSTKTILTISKAKATDEKLAQALSISEEELHEIQRLLQRNVQDLEQDLSVKATEQLIRKGKINLSTIEKTDILIRQEISEINLLIGLLDEEIDIRPKAIETLRRDIDALRELKEDLSSILENIDSWVHERRKEHKQLANHRVTPEMLKEWLSAELGAESIDIRKVHILIERFEAEKIQIIKTITRPNKELVE